GDRVFQVRVEAARLLLVDVPSLVEVADLAGDTGGGAGRGAPRDGADTGLGLLQRGPDLLGRVADRREGAEARDDNPPRLHGRYDFPLMYWMASPPVTIFSASSSGIWMSKCSSRAMTSSTVSRESAPRSSMNFAFGLTSSSSTPNCSTMISFTFSSTDFAMNPSPPRKG